MVRRIRSLEELFGDGGQNQLFAYSFSGDFAPPTCPHFANWATAGKHWITFNSEILETDAIPRSASAMEALWKAERFSVAVLFVFAELEHCPHCPMSKHLDPEKRREILDKARE